MHKVITRNTAEAFFMLFYKKKRMQRAEPDTQFDSHEREDIASAQLARPHADKQAALPK